MKKTKLDPISFLEETLGLTRSDSSGLVPKGDVRLTVNISKEHHKKLKLAAAEKGTTIGELIETFIDKNLK